MHTIPEANIDTKILHDFLKTAKVGQLITYDELSALIGRDVREAARGCMTSAIRRALRDNLVFEAVRNEGYRLLPDEKIAGVGMNAVKRIRRTASRAARKLSCVRDFDAMSNEAKVAHNTGLSVLGAIAHSAGHTAVKRVSRIVEQAATQLPIAKTLEAFRG